MPAQQSLALYNDGGGKESKKINQWILYSIFHYIKKS